MKLLEATVHLKYLENEVVIGRTILEVRCSGEVVISIDNSSCRWANVAGIDHGTMLDLYEIYRSIPFIGHGSMMFPIYSWTAVAILRALNFPKESFEIATAVLSNKEE